MITKTTKEIVEELAKYYCSKTSDFQLDEVLRIKGREWVSLKELQKALEICVLNSRTFNKKGFSGLLDCRELEEEFKRVIFGVVPLSPATDCSEHTGASTKSAKEEVLPETSRKLKRKAPNVSTGRVTKVGFPASRKSLVGVAEAEIKKGVLPRGSKAGLSEQNKPTSASAKEMIKNFKKVK